MISGLTSQKYKAKKAAERAANRGFKLKPIEKLMSGKAKYTREQAEYYHKIYNKNRVSDEEMEKRHEIFLEKQRDYQRKKRSHELTSMEPQAGLVKVKIRPTIIYAREPAAGEPSQKRTKKDSDFPSDCENMSLNVSLNEVEDKVEDAASAQMEICTTENISQADDKEDSPLSYIPLSTSENPLTFNWDSVFQSPKFDHQSSTSFDSTKLIDGEDGIRSSAQFMKMSFSE